MTQRPIGPKWWIGILLLATVLRVVWGTVVPVIPLSDSNAYHVFAVNLAQGHGYVWEAGGIPTAYWPVGTSALYALLYAIFGISVGAVVVLHIVLGVGIVALTMELARRWFDAPTARGAGVALTCWPIQIQFTTIPASELPFTFLLLGSLLACEALRDRPARRGIIAGLLLAATTYIRTTALLLPIVLAILEIVREKRVARPVVSLAVVFAVMAVAIAPWTFRNYRQFGELVLVSTNGGSVLWMGNNPLTTGEYQVPPEVPGTNEAQWNQRLGSMAKEYIRREPLRFIARTAHKAFKMHDRETIGVTWNAGGLARLTGEPAPMDATAVDRDRVLDQRVQSVLKAASTGYWYAMLVGAGAGWIVLCRRKGFWSAFAHPTLVVWAYFTGVHSVMLVADRYHFPATPMMAILIGVAVAAGVARATAARKNA